MAVLPIRVENRPPGAPARLCGVPARSPRLSSFWPAWSRRRRPYRIAVWLSGRLPLSGLHYQNSGRLVRPLFLSARQQDGADRRGRGI